MRNAPVAVRPEPNRHWGTRLVRLGVVQDYLPESRTDSVSFSSPVGTAIQTMSRSPLDQVWLVGYIAVASSVVSSGEVPT